MRWRQPLATDRPPLRIADPAFEFLPRCSSAVIRLKDRQYRMDFWPDAEWARLLPEDRPVTFWRMLTDDGWFTLVPV